MGVPPANSQQFRHVFRSWRQRSSRHVLTSLYPRPIASAGLGNCGATTELRESDVRDTELFGNFCHRCAPNEFVKRSPSEVMPMRSARRRYCEEVLKCELSGWGADPKQRLRERQHFVGMAVER